MKLSHLAKTTTFTGLLLAAASSSAFSTQEARTFNVSESFGQDIQTAAGENLSFSANQNFQLHTLTISRAAYITCNEKFFVDSPALFNGDLYSSPVISVHSRHNTFQNPIDLVPGERTFVIAAFPGADENPSNAFYQPSGNLSAADLAAACAAGQKFTITVSAED